MFFGGFFTQLPAAAIQQAEISRALEQAEEMLGRRKGLVDAQRAALVDLAEQALHALQHAHGTGLEEDLREFHVLIAGGHHQAMQVDRLLTVDQTMEPPRDIQQHSLHGHARRQLEVHHRQLFFALGHHRGGEQGLFIVEVAVHGQFRHAGLKGNGIHAGTGVAIAQKQDFRCFEDCLAFCHVLGAPGAIGVYGIVGHFHL